MASPETLDFAELLKPLSDESPAGVDLRQDSSASALYYALKDARAAARAKERDAAVDEGVVPDTRSEWRPVSEQARAILTEQSKDLEVTAWLTEALLRLEGFAGLRDGFRLTREIIDGFWEECFPTPDEDGLATKVAPLTGLNGEDAEGTLIVPIRNVYITEGSSQGPFACWHYQQAVALQQIADPEKRQRRIDSGAVTLEQFDQAGVETSPGFFRTCFEDLSQCADEYQKLCATLDERCGDAAPPSSNIRNALNECLEALKYVARDSLQPQAEEAAEARAGAGAQAPGTGGGVRRGQQPQSREEAFRTLLDLAEFFRRTEPHSPLSYALEQAVRWGRMPLPELLEELVSDDQTRQHLFRLAGIRKSEGSN